MKRSCILFSLVIAAQATTGFAGTFVPEEGYYSVVKEIGHPTPTDCKFGAEAMPKVTEITGATSSGFNIDFVGMFPDGDSFTFASTPCGFNGNGRGFTCEYAEQVTDFAFVGLDAVMTVEGETWHGAWPSTNAFHFVAAPVARTECIGSHCWLVASFFGAEFEWGCRINPKGYRYIKQ